MLCFPESMPPARALALVFLALATQCSGVGRTICRAASHFPTSAVGTQLQPACLRCSPGKATQFVREVKMYVWEEEVEGR